MSEDNTKKQPPELTPSIHDNGNEAPEYTPEEQADATQGAYESFSDSIDPQAPPPSAGSKARQFQSKAGHSSQQRIHSNSSASRTT